MTAADSTSSAHRLAEARALLARPGRSESPWSVLGAAALFAATALAFAVAMILAPPVITRTIAEPPPIAGS